MKNTWDTQKLELLDKVFGVLSFSKEQLDAIQKGIGNSHKVLDLCVGFGNLAKRLVEEGRDVYGIDISDDSLDFARKRIGDGHLGELHLIKGNVRKLKYENEFDAATCVSTMNFPNSWLRPRLRKVAEGVYKALKPSGVLVFSAFDGSKSRESGPHFHQDWGSAIEDGRLSLSLDEIALLQTYGGHGSSLKSPEEMSKIFESAGFSTTIIDRLYHDTMYVLAAQKE